MYIVQIHVRVKENRIQDFIEASKENAKNSILESGIVKFDIIQQLEEPTKFILFEIYKTDQDSAKHKDTKHYRIWRGMVENMMAEPRQSMKYRYIFPEDE
jgi:autoinducer 2-degrading protein